MRAEEIRGHLKELPFRPIRLFVSDGSTYDIPHPDFMIVSRAEVVVAIHLGNGDIPERFAYFDPVHITRIEPINGQ